MVTRPEVRDVAKLTEQELRWRRRAERSRNLGRTYILLALVAGVVLVASLVIGWFIGRA
jgi:hypothetical protein